MSDNTTPITFTNGAWITRPGDACTEIINDETDEVIGMADHHGDAVLWACSKRMLEAMIVIQETITVQLPDGTPVEKTLLEAAQILKISALINGAFEQIANEVTL